MGGRGLGLTSAHFNWKVTTPDDQIRKVVIGHEMYLNRDEGLPLLQGFAPFDALTEMDVTGFYYQCNRTQPGATTTPTCSVRQAPSMSVSALDRTPTSSSHATVCSCSVPPNV